MFSNLLRQQARLALASSSRTAVLRQSQKSLLARVTTQSQILSQRTFSISRSLFEENEVAPEKPRRDHPSNSVTEALGRRILYVANLPYTAEPEEIKDLFIPYGEVSRVLQTIDQRGRPSGIAFVEYTSPGAAQRAVESGKEEPFALGDRTLSVYYSGRMPREWQTEPMKPCTQIHFSNFPYPGDEDALREMLEDYKDKISRVHFMVDHQKQPTRKAFVTFDSLETAKEVHERFGRGFILDGVRLGVFYAKDKTQSHRRRAPDQSGGDAPPSSGLFDA